MQGRIQEFGLGQDGERFSRAYNAPKAASRVQGQIAWSGGQEAKPTPPRSGKTFTFSMPK